MTENELRNLMERAIKEQCEKQTTEIRSAHLGCPERLYDTISSFSNQDKGGTLLFGLDERQHFQKVGVYDAQDLQKKVMEACEQMTPVVRPLFTVLEEDGLLFVSAEIPPLDLSERPCFKTAKGRIAGSYVRVGEADKPMTEQEIYNFEAFRKKSRDDLRVVERASFELLDPDKVSLYLLKKKEERANLSALPEEKLYELCGITGGGAITLMAFLLFGIYPQAFFPQLSILATCIPGSGMGDTDFTGARFTDSKRIEGTIPEMLEGALGFVRSNMHTKTLIDPKTGNRKDIPQYPLEAVREALLNALVHRDYSIHTEGKPIQFLMFEDRMEIISPGGLYGRISVEELGNVQPDTRNPSLVTAMETLGKTENRYSGIPTIKSAMEKQGLPMPLFMNTSGSFRVILYNGAVLPKKVLSGNLTFHCAWDEKGLLDFCRRPRSRKEILDFLAIPSSQYALKRYLDPLVKSGAMKMTIPERPRSENQKFYSAE